MTATSVSGLSTGRPASGVHEGVAAPVTGPPLNANRTGAVRPDTQAKPVGPPGPKPARIPSGRLRPGRDTPAARRMLLLVTVLATLVHLPRSRRTVRAISAVSRKLAPDFGLRSGLSAKNFEREKDLGAIYRRARFGTNGKGAPNQPCATALARAESRSEAELRAVIRDRDAELRELRAFNVVACVREFRKQIGR